MRKVNWSVSILVVGLLAVAGCAEDTEDRVPDETSESSEALLGTYAGAVLYQSGFDHYRGPFILTKDSANAACSKRYGERAYAPSYATCTLRPNTAYLYDCGATCYWLPGTRF